MKEPILTYSDNKENIQWTKMQHQYHLQHRVVQPNYSKQNKKNMILNPQAKHYNVNHREQRFQPVHPSLHMRHQKIVKPGRMIPTTRRGMAKITKPKTSTTITPFIDRYIGFNISNYLSKSKFSNRIFSTVWSDCDRKCYYKDNYSFYKKRVISNINLLREYHKVGNLIEDPLLSKLAQEHAERMAKKEMVFRDKITKYGETIGVIYYPAASTVVTKWYDERFFYKFGTNYPRPGTQMLTQMLWKQTKEIGVGVVKFGDYLYIDCKFYPKGNIKGHYKKNVFKRRFKWFKGK